MKREAKPMANVHCLHARTPLARAMNITPHPSNTTSEEMVDILTSHLINAFDNYEQRQHVVENLELTLHQSIVASDTATLSFAVSAASDHLTNKRIGSESSSSSLPRSSAVFSAASFTASALQTIDLKMKQHKSFVDFLVHAGVYKRVDLRGRMKVRDHGEMIYAIGVLLTLWQDELEDIRQKEDVGDGSYQSSMIDDEKILEVSQKLRSIDDTVTDFPNFLFVLIRSFGFKEDRYVEKEVPWPLFQICQLISGAIEGAISFRNEQSVMIYDLKPDSDEVGWGQQTSRSFEGGCFPWTSRSKILSVLPQVLRVYDEGNFEKSGVIIRSLGRILLDGYRDITPKLRDEMEYHEAKGLVVSLARKFCPSASGNPTDDLAFQLSVQYGYFAGIVESCQNNISSDGSFSDEYDLRSILQICTSTSSTNNSIDDPYYALSQIQDQETGLSFAKFVFRWFTDRNMVGRVLTLGKACPSILSEYMQEDARLSGYRWIQCIDNGQYKDASSCLKNLVSEGTSILCENVDSGPSIEDRRLVSSLVKLSSLATVENF